jgi:hypothetical protein
VDRCDLPYNLPFACAPGSRRHTPAPFTLESSLGRGQITRPEQPNFARKKGHADDGYRYLQSVTFFAAFLSSFSCATSG